MKRDSIIILVLLLFSPLLTFAVEAKPNFVLFLADDLGWTGLSSFGSDLYETPNLDRLAEQGVKFTNAYAACTVCSPSRAAIITGKYPARLHLTDFIAGQNRPFAKLKIPDWQKGLQHDEITLAEALKEAGYKSAHVGKWHLHPSGGKSEDFDPVDHGFDHQVFKPVSKNNFLTKTSGEFSKGDFITDYLAAEAVKVVDQWKDDPFFLYFAFHVPHTPVSGKAELVDEYAGKIQTNAKHQNPHYAAMVHSMDEAVGSVLGALERNGLAENTVVVFTSDNGGLTQRFGKLDGFTDNSPLRRGKGSAYEGGVRVPQIIKWPGVTPAGTDCSEPVIGMDFYSTFLEMAGVTDEQKQVDGVSLVPVLRNPGAELKREAIFWHYPHYHAGGDGPYSAVRARDWRLIHSFEEDSVSLYNLKSDPGEKSDLAAENPGKAESMFSILNEWRSKVGAQLPEANAAHDLKRESEVQRKKKKK